MSDKQDIDYWVEELEFLLQDASDNGFSISRSVTDDKGFVIYDEFTGRIRVIGT